MEAIAFALGLDPILTRGQQLVDQYRTSRDNKQNVAQLHDQFASFETDLQYCITRLHVEAAKLPLQSRAVIEKDVLTLSTYLTSANAALQSIKRRLNQNLMLQFFRANKTAKSCDELTAELDKARQLLRDAEKHVDLRSAVQRIGFGQSQAPVDKFTNFFPPLSSGVQAALDFDSRHDDGRPVTPEGWVKYHLLARSSDTPHVISVHGIGGVGKSTIMRALSVDCLVRERFPHGVYTIKLGKEASTVPLFRQICQVLKESGAEKIYLSIRSQNDIDAALRFFESWFDGKKCAFLIDDVWTHGVGIDLLSRLCKIDSALNERKQCTDHDERT